MGVLLISKRSDNTELRTQSMMPATADRMDMVWSSTKAHGTVDMNSLLKTILRGGIRQVGVEVRGEAISEGTVHRHCRVKDTTATGIVNIGKASTTSAVGGDKVACTLVFREHWGQNMALGSIWHKIPQNNLSEVVY